MTLLSLISRNIFRRPMRSALTCSAVAVAIGAVVALVGISDGFEESFLQLYRSAGVDLLVVKSGGQESINSVVDESMGDQLRRVPGVALVEPSLMDMISFSEANLYGVPIRGMPPETPALEHLHFIEGRPPTANDERVVALGKSLAGQLHKQVGEIVRLYDVEEYRVVGIFDAASVFENASLIVPLTDLQRLSGRLHLVNGFTIQVSDHQGSGAIDDVIGRIERERDKQGKPLGVRAISASDHVESQTQLRLARAMAWITSAIALVAGTIGVLNTMFMSVMERTREIGMLRAVGWRRHRIVRMILGESITISLIGAVLGSVGAMLLTRWLSTMSIVSGLVEGRISWEVVGQGMLLALLVGLLGVAYPAYRSAHILPTEALRHE